MLRERDDGFSTEQFFTKICGNVNENALYDCSENRRPYNQAGNEWTRNDLQEDSIQSLRKILK